MADGLLPALPPTAADFGVAPPPPPRGPLSRRDRIVLLAVGVAGLLAFSLAATFFILWLRCGGGGCPDVNRLRAYQPGKASRVLDRHGRLFSELRPVEGATVPLNQVSPHVRAAFIAVEDQRFYRHMGVDVPRVFGAAIANLREKGYQQGFSTITMQLARNLFPERIPARERTLARKLREIRVAFALERRFDKDEILELYLSHIYFGNGARGVEAAARHYFGASAGKLTLAQAALLAAIPKGPAHFDPRQHPDRARERRNLVLSLMERQRRVTREEARAAQAAPLGVVRARGPAGQEPGLAPYFVEEVRRQLEESLGERLYAETLQVTTTLDVDAQRAAEEELEQQLRAVEAGRLGRFSAPRFSAAAVPMGESTPYLQGALVALETGTGDVLAWVGGRDFRHSRFDRVRSSSRQTGSAFKPFVYAAALGEGHYLSEPLQDAPIRIQLSRTRFWEPRNYDGDYEGVVTMREALVRSKNIPTVELAGAVGVEDVARTAQKAGIHSPIDPTPAMALGTVAVSPLELATAYGAFAGLGRAAVPRTVLSVRAEDGQELFAAGPPRVSRLLDAGVAYLVTNVLQDAVVRGTGAAVGASGLEVPAAGKTGTTNDSTDTWFVGYTPDLVAAVWMGFDERRPIMRAATGGRLAAPAWARMMKRVYAKRPVPAPWQAPAGVFSALVDPHSGAPLAQDCRPWDGEPYRELFLRGKAPARVCPDSGSSFWTIFRSPGWDDDEEDAWRRARREREEAQKRRRQEIERDEERRREAAEKAQRQARKQEERLRKEWKKRMKELEKRRREAERRRRDNRDG
jgi:penicillin-binding protein 1A